MLVGAARALGHELESDGISVIPCGGKSSLDRPTAIFRHLGIPVYVVWDGDEGEKDAKAEDNHRLLRLLDKPIVDWPCEVNGTFACFRKSLETTLRDEIGAAEFDTWLAECQAQFGITKRKHAIKNPAVIASILQKAQGVGRSSATVNNIVEQIIAKKAGLGAQKGVLADASEVQVRAD